MKETNVDQWIDFGEKKICFPKVETVFKAIKKNQGITMLQLHDMGYRLVYGAIHDLIEKESIFEDGGKFYTNN